MKGISTEWLLELMQLSNARPENVWQKAQMAILESLISECKELNPWQPIETAPKCHEVVVYNPMTGVYVSKFIDGNWPYFGWNELTGFKLDKDDPTASVHYPHPTHWKELPPGPKD